MQQLPLEAIENFWKRVEKTESCWIWTGAVNADKMPVFGIGTQKKPEERFGARRISLLLAGQNVLPIKKIRPLICNNYLCVNPSHLVTGDKAIFLMKIQKLSEENGGCWVWIGTTDAKGYGVIQLSEPRRHQVKAHRYSWELYTGRKAPDNIQVCHTCDHPYCVNPHHLFLGTNQDNIDDKSKKGRASKKLTIPKVRDIKSILQLGELTQTEIANMYGVSKTTINSIHLGKIWKTVIANPSDEKTSFQQESPTTR